MPVTNNHLKKEFTRKFLEFQLYGLEKYARYLNDQIKLSKKNDTWTAYKRYIEKEIIRNDKKILDVKNKLA